MLAKTRYFGTIDLDESRIITFERGIMGFEGYKKWALLYDIEAEGDNNISWLQSLEEANLALPVVSPFCLVEEYAPIVEDEQLESLGEFADEDLMVLLALTVPTEVKKTTANFKAPFIINPNTAQGVQVIAENEDYPVRFQVYEAVQQKKTANEQGQPSK